MKARLQGDLSVKPAVGTEGRGYDGRRLGLFAGPRKGVPFSGKRWAVLADRVKQPCCESSADAKASKLSIGWSRRDGARYAT